MEDQKTWNCGSFDWCIQPFVLNQTIYWDIYWESFNLGAQSSFQQASGYDPGSSRWSPCRWCSDHEHSCSLHLPCQWLVVQGETTIYRFRFEFHLKKSPVSILCRCISIIFVPFIRHPKLWQLPFEMVYKSIFKKSRKCCHKRLLYPIGSGLWSTTLTVQKQKPFPQTIMHSNMCLFLRRGSFKPTKHNKSPIIANNFCIIISNVQWFLKITKSKKAFLHYKNQKSLVLKLKMQEKFKVR